MDPVTVGLILGLIERLIVLSPEIVALIKRARAGEKITREEIERTESLVLASVKNWKDAGKPAQE